MPYGTPASVLRGQAHDMFSWDLLANAVVAGVLLGGFYAAVIATPTMHGTSRR